MSINQKRRNSHHYKWHWPHEGSLSYKHKESSLVFTFHFYFECTNLMNYFPGVGWRVSSNCSTLGWPMHHCPRSRRPAWRRTLSCRAKPCSHMDHSPTIWTSGFRAWLHETNQRLVRWGPHLRIQADQRWTRNRTLFSGILFNFS